MEAVMNAFHGLSPWIIGTDRDFLTRLTVARHQAVETIFSAARPSLAGVAHECDIRLRCRQERFVGTTTIRLDDELKARVAEAAERAGKTSHGFILGAIVQTVEQDERKDQFQREADERWAKILDRRKTVPWDEMRTYLTARAEGGRSLRRRRARKVAR
jgi:predicted transcriptional regulator